MPNARLRGLVLQDRDAGCPRERGGREGSSARAGSEWWWSADRGRPALGRPTNPDLTQTPHVRVILCADVSGCRIVSRIRDRLPVTDCHSDPENRLHPPPSSLWGVCDLREESLQLTDRHARSALLFSLPIRQDLGDPSATPANLAPVGFGPDCVSMRGLGMTMPPWTHAPHSDRCGGPITPKAWPTDPPCTALTEPC